LLADRSSHKGKRVGQMIAVLAVAVVLAYVRGIYAVLKSDAKPNCLSWVIWACIDVVLIVSSLMAAESVSTIVLLLIYMAGAVVIVAVSRKNLSGLNIFERAAVAVATLSLVGWVVTGNASVALGLVILAHLCGTILTLKSVWQVPRSEDWVMWTLFVAGNIANLLAISWINWQNWLFPVYETAVCVIVTLLALRRKHP